MFTTETPALIQAAVHRLVRDADADRDLTPAALAIVAAHAARWYPGITADSDYDLSGHQETQANIYGVRYTRGPYITMWSRDGRCGVHIETDTTLDDGRVYSHGYSSAVSWG